MHHNTFSTSYPTITQMLWRAKSPKFTSHEIAQAFFRGVMFFRPKRSRKQ
jgi:hypothetical protein